MQFIQKQQQAPENWYTEWFCKQGEETIPSYDYKRDYSGYTKIADARRFLLEEQSYLCAYCQKEITLETSSIEHILPKTFNPGLSTNYFNLVVVCKSPPKEENTHKYHCDKQRGDAPLVPFIFYNDCQVSSNTNHPYFLVESNGTIFPKYSKNCPIFLQRTAFLEILYLNHENLKKGRKDKIDQILKTVANIREKDDKRKYFEGEFNRIYNDPTIEFRQFLLAWLSTKLGRN